MIMTYQTVRDFFWFYYFCLFDLMNLEDFFQPGQNYNKMYRTEPWYNKPCSDPEMLGFGN